MAVEMKGPQDFVTKADRAVEEFIVERLSAAFPDDGFIGEEGGQPARGRSGPRSGSSIRSTALQISCRAGANGAFRSGWCKSGDRPSASSTIRAPTSSSLPPPAMAPAATASRSMLATHDDAAEATIALEYSLKTPPAAHLAQIAAVLRAGGEYRRNGSAALSLAHVADGRLDGFVELHVYAWDVPPEWSWSPRQVGGRTVPLQGDLRRLARLLPAALGCEPISSA